MDGPLTADRARSARRPMSRSGPNLNGDTTDTRFIQGNNEHQTTLVS